MFLRISLLVLLAVPGLIDPAWAAEATVSAPQIVSRIDEAQRVTLQGNTPPQARPENDLGRVPDSLPLPGLQLALRRPALQERLVEKLIRDQLDRKSTRYHRWISADEYGWKFGVAIQDVNRIVSWLGAHGFTVKNVSRSRMRIDFSGTAGEVREAFHTEIHRLHVHGEDHIANMDDPQIPAAVAPAVAGIAWLNDFRPKPQYTRPPPDKCQPFDRNTNWASDNKCYWVVPADLWKIYNFPTSSYDGTGQIIAVMEDADPSSSQDWCDFRAEFFGETTCKTGLFNEVHPNCNDPGPNPPALEVLIDPQWASAAAPGALINLTSCQDNGTNWGYLIALQNLVDSNPPLPQIISMSYGFCEASLGLGGMSLLDATYQQADAEGFSVFVAAGDAGAAVCDWASGYGYATQGIAVSGYASSPYVVAVGGTTFADWALGAIPNPYWGSNGNLWRSALSYIPEIPWNSSCGNWLLALFYNFKQTYGQKQFCNSEFPPGMDTFNVVLAGSGGPSACAIPVNGPTGCAGYPKPSWQSGILGNPADGVRDVPDVSIIAGGGEWGHFLVYCNSPNNGRCTANTPHNFAPGGGTSFSAPIFAGIQALINQRVGENGGNSAVGNPNPNYYTFAKSEFGQNGNTNCLSTHAAAGNSCIFYDITYLNSHDDSTIVVPCELSNGVSNNNCYFPDAAPVGVLSTDKSNYAPAYAIHSQFGWDFTTGIGSPNVTNLVNAWPVP
jgi:subtilase family serine protease